MSPTYDYQHGRIDEALVRWGKHLAAGRSWRDVEDEILYCCQGRVDLLTALLVQAEILSWEVDAGSRRSADPGRERTVLPSHPGGHWSSPEPSRERPLGKGRFELVRVPEPLSA